MKGTDLTEDQIQSAREFACARQRINRSGAVFDDATEVTLRFGDLARLVAWYGAIRFQAGEKGIGGTLEKPGPMDVIR